MTTITVNKPLATEAYFSIPEAAGRLGISEHALREAAKGAYSLTIVHSRSAGR